MKKLTALLLTGILAVGMTACTKNTEDNTQPEETTVITETDNTDITDSTDNTNGGNTEAEPDAEPEVAAPVLPEVKGVTHDMDFELIGCNFTLDSDEIDPVIRLWFTITNNSDSYQSPSYLESWDGLIATQGDEELRGWMTRENYLEDRVTLCELLPGTTVVFTDTYKMVSETEVVKFVLTADNDEVIEFEIDPTTFVEVIPETYVWESVTDYSWFESKADEYTSFDITYSIADIQVVEGTDWMSENDTTNIRIVLNVTNNAASEKTVYNVFTPFQDGVELELGLPNETDDTDIRINTKIPAGESRQIACTYVLYNKNTPVLFVAKKFSDVYGQVYELN